MTVNLAAFAEKFMLAVEQDASMNPTGGTTGLELEWNLYNASFQPQDRMNGKSFIDHLRAEIIPQSLASFNKLEVFNWMTEWIARPYYYPHQTVYEGWLLEAAVLNVLAHGKEERFYAYHGNLLHPADVTHADIPASFHLAKRRYLERCVDLYGGTLATAGTHVNVSLPESLLEWDFMHLSPVGRGNDHLDNYKNRVYVEGARLLRAFAALSIAITASTPMRVDRSNGDHCVILTDVDSNRSLTFPNDSNLDIPCLYRSYEDYVRLSYDLVGRGVRFGNNNWTPVRARSNAEPVERLIRTTSDQLQDLYNKGIYVNDETMRTVEEMAQEIERTNLRARIDLPMSRVELRTDDWGHDIELDIAHLSLVELLLMRVYADSTFARAFRYDMEDIARARRNESVAATHGMHAEIENPFTGKPVPMRDFLTWTLKEVELLAELTGRSKALEPLITIAQGAPNTAERLRNHIQSLIGKDQKIVPLNVLQQLAEEREAQVGYQVQHISESVNNEQLKEISQMLHREAELMAQPRISFKPRVEEVIVQQADTVTQIVELSKRLIAIPSVTNCPDERLDEVKRASYLIESTLKWAGLDVKRFDEGPYPALLASFPGQLKSPVMLSGHFDVVKPQPDDSQFEPRVDGDYLWGRGAADMKTVIATYLVWMKDEMKRVGSKPHINLLLIGNEENGEIEPSGTPHVLDWLRKEHGYAPDLFIAGERTEETGSQFWGNICVENRGVARFKIIARGKAGHTGVAGAQKPIVDQLVAAQHEVSALFNQHLTLQSADGWQSAARFPFISVGESGIYNITASRGELGIEVRSIPQDSLEELIDSIRAYTDGVGLELIIEVQDAGITCDLTNLYLQKLIEAVREASNQEPRIDKKLPGTSARFAPSGQGVVWGQSGLGPHAADERHYIPSIQPYYSALVALGERLREKAGFQMTNDT